MDQKNPEIQNLLNTNSRYQRKSDKELILKAWKFAKLAHDGQKRLNGEDFISHPYKVAQILADWKLDATSIAAGLLHDTVEVGAATTDDIKNEFGDEVALLVDGVTKVTSVRLKGSSNEIFVESLRKMILVMAKDLRVVLLKLADRIHNMQTLAALSREKQHENAIETLEVYSPLAERLGMGEVKGILDDLAFPYAYPEIYKRIVRESRTHYSEAEKHIHSMKAALLKKFRDNGVDVDVNGRKKHYYSLWKKLERDSIQWDFDKVHDIVAFRIIVKDIESCYLVLGIVHSLYKPAPYLNISDYIAQPKPNGYRSIHTKVFGSEGQIIEVQIRTQQMHDQAEYGAAAHWAYADKKSLGVKDKILEKQGIVVDPKKLSWVKQLVEWQKDLSDTEEFLKAVKFDAFQSRNFIFSPKGDIYDLPVGATPVDYAFAVHTQLGKYIKATIVNGHVVPLHYKLKSGDIVEIVKAKNQNGPYVQWLEFVVTAAARRAIKKAIE